MLTLWLQALAACGGGGGGSGGGDVPPPDPPPTRVAIAGTLFIASISQSDSDVNDPTAAYQANDVRAQAQVIPAPVALPRRTKGAPRRQRMRSARSSDSLPPPRPARYSSSAGHDRWVGQASG